MKIAAAQLVAVGRRRCWTSWNRHYLALVFLVSGNKEEEKIAFRDFIVNYLLSHDLCKESLRFAIANKSHVSSRKAVGDQIRTELFYSFSQEKEKHL